MTKGAAILQFHGEAVGHAQRDDGGRDGADDHAVEHAGETLTYAACHRCGVSAGGGAVLVVLELDEAHACTFRNAGHAVARHVEVGFHNVLFIVQRVVGYLLELVGGLLHRGVRGQVHEGDDSALVFRGQEGGGQVLVDHAEHAEQGQVDDHEAAAAQGELVHAAGVAHLILVEDAVEPAEEAVLCALGMSLEHAGAERRGEDEGHQHRERHGGDDGHGELAVDDARGAGHEGHGQEHGGKHHADADEGGADLVHGFLRGRHRIEMLFLNEAFHVFDHDDGVVHQQADG